MRRYIVEVKNLSKQFDGKTVVDNVSFGIEKKSFFAFLGQNGAGKSTTINMIIGLLSRDGGEILYGGGDGLAAFKNKIGVVFQNNVLDEQLTVEENLLTYGALYINSKQKVKETYNQIIKMLELEDIKSQRFKTLSGGQKRKTEIARAIFTQPEVLFLDEPTTGLDPKTRAEVWTIINNLKSQTGLTVFLTTHYMEEAASADCVAIIDKGKISAMGSPANLKLEYTGDKLTIKPKSPQMLERQLKELERAYVKTADTYTVKVDSAPSSIDVLCRLKDNIESFEVVKGSMDDVFLNVVGKQIIGGGGAV